MIQQATANILVSIADFDDEGNDNVDLSALQLTNGFAALTLTQDGTDVDATITSMLELRFLDTLFGDLDEVDFLF